MIRGFLVAYAFSLPATADYIAFMKIESSSSLKIRLDYIFGIYFLFMIGVIGRYLWRLVQILRDQDFEAGISHSAEHYGE